MSQITNPATSSLPGPAARATASGSGTNGGTYLYGSADASEQSIDFKIAAALFGGMLLIASLIAWFIFPVPETEGYGGHAPLPPQAQFFAIAAALMLGLPIVLDAFFSLVRGMSHSARTAHMEGLIALAIIVAFADGQYLECGAVAFFMLISSFIEDRTAVGARRTIESLISITPTIAHRVKTDESGQTREEQVSAYDLRPDDVVIVRPGDAIPGDGVVLGGESTVNQANITGESLPVDKRQGDEVFSGTINESGRLEVRITHAGEDSTLGKVQQLILDAARSKPVVMRLLEQYASYYTPTVLMVAVIVFIFTQDLNRVISLLLISCPCAIILAGPTAVVASLSAAARLGVYIKSVTDLEIARRVTAIVFDKTGTLTEGRLSVTRMKPVEGVSGAELLRLCVSAEADSRHPVARAVQAIAAKAKVSPLATEQFEEVAGRGVVCRVPRGDGEPGSHEVIVGRESFLKERGVDTSSLDLAEAEGYSLLLVARDGVALGWLGLEDTVRANAKPAMDELHQAGIQRRVMITGDRWSPAEKVARSIHVTDVEAEALPGDKLALVEQLKKAGHTVAVVGDGVNDGPALAAGDVSIAMGAAGSGSDVAIHSANIALMNNQLDRIPFLFRLSKSTVSVMRQNLAGTGLYILIMLILLAVGWITPLIAAIGHGVSSVLVVFNSARLIRHGEHLSEGEVHAPVPQSGLTQTIPQLRHISAAPA